MSDIRQSVNARTSTGAAWSRAGAAAAVGAAAANLVVLAVARATDASLVVVDNGEAHGIDAGGVIFSSVVPVVIGVALTALVALRWRGVVRLAQVVGGGFALISVAGPLSIDTDAGTAAALALMHVVVGAAFVAGLEWARRSLTSSPASGAGAPGAALVPTDPAAGVARR